MHHEPQDYSSQETCMARQAKNEDSTTKIPLKQEYQHHLANFQEIEYPKSTTRDVDNLREQR
jgi:hypothetical protein